jgi:hypothetical protein
MEKYKAALDDLCQNQANALAMTFNVEILGDVRF